MTQFVSNIKSQVIIHASELVSLSTLPTKDYAIRMEYDINNMWAGLKLPNRPITDDIQNIEQGIDLGSSPDNYFSKIQQFKDSWGNHDTNNDLTLVYDITKVLRYVLDPSNTSLLEIDSFRNIDFAAKIDPEKVRKWIQTPKQNTASHNSFYDEVFQKSQIVNILDQIRNIQAYDTNGEVKLAEGSEIGVVVCLQTSAFNEFTLHIFLKQKTVPDETIEPDQEIDQESDQEIEQTTFNNDFGEYDMNILLTPINEYDAALYTINGPIQSA